MRQVRSSWQMLADAGRTRGSYLHSAAIANFGLRVSAIWHPQQARETPQGKACGFGRHRDNTQQLTEIGPVLAAGVGLNLRRHALAACQIRRLASNMRRIRCACLLPWNPSREASFADDMSRCWPGTRGRGRLWLSWGPSPAPRPPRGVQLLSWLVTRRHGQCFGAV